MKIKSCWGRRDYHHEISAFEQEAGTLRIESKALLVMTVALAAIFTLHTASTYFEVNRQLNVVEENSVLNDLNRTYYFLTADMKQLDSFTLDWATWDDSYNFMQTKSQAYIASNFAPQTLMNARIDLAVYADARGRTFYCATGNAATKGFQVPVSWLISPPSNLLGSPALGLMEISASHGIAIVSSRPILRSDGTGPAMGTLIFARILDRQELNLISNEINLSVDAYALDSPTAAAAKSLLHGRSQMVQFFNQTTVFGFMWLDDVYNQPIAILKISEPRLVTQGVTSILTPLSVIFASLSVATIGLVSIVVYNIAVKPANHLRRIIEQIDDPSSAPALEQIANQRTDEIGFVAAEIWRMLTRLRESEASLRRLVKNIPVGFVRTTHNGQILIANPAFAQLLKYPDGELIRGVNMNQIYVNPEGRNEILQRVWNTTESVEAELDFRQKDGQRITVLGSVYQAVDEVPHKYVEGIFFDITERKKYEAKLAEYATSLEQLVNQRTAQLLQSERLATIGRVAAMVAHDIRNPLTAIKLSAYYLRRILGPSATLGERDSLDAIDGAMRRANSIVEDLYVYSKDIALDLSDVMLHQLIEESIRQVQITPSVHLEMKVPSVKIQVDVNRLQRVFVNLIKNAVEAMPNGGNLKITARLRDEFVELSFEDSGIGMDAEMLANVWQPFVTSKSKGMGLGLSICKRFIEAHGGTISVHSIPTQGTTIEILLPLEQRRPNRKEGSRDAE